MCECMAVNVYSSGRVGVFGTVGVLGCELIGMCFCER